jgi:ADP-ribose pyrophosphatase YjhB (NUDIX family)
MPLACVDILFENAKGEILYGFRKIEPYKDVWALLGGRLLYRENLLQAARRIGREYGLRFSELYLVGVFPISFPTRSDLPIALAALNASGRVEADGFEFSKFTWSKRTPPSLGSNYARMVSEWRRKRESREYLKLSTITDRTPHKSGSM